MDGNQNQSQMGQNITPNQNQIPQQAVPTQMAQSITQQPQPQIPQAPSPQKSSHIVRTLLIMVVLAIVVILMVLVYVSFVNNKSNTTESMQIEKTPTSMPIPATTEGQLNRIDVGNVDDDLKAVDADVQTL